ncbi:tRNA-uridine aminocarboxypropyltransferase [Marinifaba aquimaris]|uniref:tRNA-uridine aminocarboxypropyltransferase n=1 Tax=Marinifaba aquimaris TaxID=2741323 RepID=UPI001C2DE28F|nr:DTW domain-containing protein [Marinifaba aquimaris]
MSENSAVNAFKKLRHERLKESSRPFNARGKLLKRCPECQLGEHVCICGYQVKAELNFDFVLLMHRDEILKPTNTGRLIADLFPEQTHACCWHRTEPSADLLAILNDPKRQCLIVFPAEATETRAVYSSFDALAPKIETDKRLTFILLDGTWKQAKRMVQLSRYLDTVPAFSFDINNAGEYAVRKALKPNQVCTAEAASLLIEQMKEPDNAQLLLDYFTVFNQHYASCRNAQQVTPGPSHANLLAQKNK